MATDITVVTYDAPLTAGMNIVVVWPNYTMLPGQDTLNGVASRYGDPFQLSYWEAQHVGIAMKKDVAAMDVYADFRKAAAGNAPLLLSLPPDFDSVVSAEVKKSQFQAALSEGVAAIQSGAIYGARFPATGTSWTERLLYVGLGVGALYLLYKGYQWFSGRRPARGRR